MAENEHNEGQVGAAEESAAAFEDHGHDDHHHGPNHYRNIYFALVVLFLISVAGPELGIRWVTLVTAFGIAIVKANLVVQHFMHLKWEKRLMKWMLATSLILMALMLAGVSPDVLNHEGNNWQNVAAQAAVERGLAGEEVGEEEGDGGEVVVAAFNAESMFNVVCATCHGTEGLGDGPSGMNLDPQPASFADAAFWAERDRDRIVNVITNGATAVGGSALMVGWSASFDADQIEQLADYVMTFQPQ